MPKQLQTILLVEDDIGHATLLLRTLRRVGIQAPIKHVLDGTRAFEYLTVLVEAQETEGLLVLLDLNLPGYSGREILRWMRGREVIRDIPVMVLTTTHDPREVEDCYALGCSALLTKPIVAGIFLEEINKTGMQVAVNS